VYIGELLFALRNYRIVFPYIEVDLAPVLLVGGFDRALGKKFR
jgi:hypothetical protein